jgi:hypothetical protein
MGITYLSNDSSVQATVCSVEKYRNPKSETLNKSEKLNSNLLIIEMFEKLEFRICLGFRYSNFGFLGMIR